MAHPFLETRSLTKPVIYIYAPKPSTGVRVLVKEIRALGTPCRRARRDGRIPENAFVVSWGWPLLRPQGVLNNGIRRVNKLEELRVFEREGIRTVPFTTEPQDGFLPRSRRHRSGNDLNTPPTNPDFYVRKIDFDREFRVHVFRGKSIRLGLKFPKENAHEWIRTGTNGWRFSYGLLAQELYVKGVRDAAKRAVAALGYDFGAVDVACVGNKPYVLEVNSAPGLENENTAKAYARHIVAAYVETL